MSTSSDTPASAGQTTAESIKVSWSDETDQEAGRDFVGVIVKAEYPYSDPKSQFEGVQIRFLVRAEQPVYENLQPIWIPPSNKRGTKFVLFRNAIAKDCPQAWRELLPAIQAQSDPAKQLEAFYTGLVGMKFHFVDKTFERPNNPKETMKLCIPVAYLGRGAVTEVHEEKVAL
jgi:hypothetical protein